MYVEIAAARARRNTLIGAMELAASNMLDQMDHLRLLEKLLARRRTNRFYRSEVLADRQYRAQEHMCSVDDPKQAQIDVYFDPRWSLTLEYCIESMGVEVNMLKQEILPPQPPPW